MTSALTLLEPTALEVLNRRGTGLLRVFRSLIPAAWQVAFERLSVYEEKLTPYVGKDYSREKVTAALQDDAVSDALRKLTEATLTLDKQHPQLSKTTPVWLIVPLRVLLDRQVRTDVAFSIRLVKEAMESIRHIGPFMFGPSGESPTAGRSLTAFVYDQSVPVEVAKRLLAGIRSRVTMDLLQTARRHRSWKTASIKAALTDWSEALQSALGLIAGYPGVVIPSLPRDRVFDLRGEVERHERRRQRLVGDADRAASELKK